MNARMCRGYLGVFGPQIEALAQEYIKALTDLRHGQNVKLKQGEYHITIASKPELQSLRASGTLPSEDSASLPGLSQLNDDLLRPSSSLIAYGLGSNQQGVYWVTVVWAGGQRFRSQLGLTPKQFHITLTSIDEHGIDKGPSSVIWTKESLSFVRKVLYQSDLDSGQQLSGISLDDLAQIEEEHLVAFAYGLLAQNEASLAQSAAELLVTSAPSSSRSFVCLGDVSVQRQLWKLGMLSFGRALELHLDDLTPDVKSNRISAYCLRQLRRSAEHTEWGSIFVDDELDELPASPTIRAYLCQNWSSTLRLHLQTAYQNAEPSRWPSRSLKSRIRMSTVQTMPSQVKSSDAPVSDTTSSDIHSITDLIDNLAVEPYPVALPATEISGHGAATHRVTAQYTLPRFFSWVVPFYMALMSTPRNAGDISALASSHVGICHVITLTEETPLPNVWFEQPSSAHVRHTHIPVPNYKPPSLEQMDIILRRIYEPGGTPVLIHCGGGKGRAGTVAACYLAAFGFEPIPNQETSVEATPAMSANEAIAALRLMRPGSIETTQQEDFVKSWVSTLWKRRSLLLPRVTEPSPTPLFTDGAVNASADLFLLCGLPGSGKSWFSRAIVGRGGFVVGQRNRTPIWRIISQDESGSRATCENDIGRAGAPGSRAILDRCNPTSEERREWLKLASWAQHPVCVWFDYDPHLCIDRAQNRIDHPTLIAGPRVRAAVASMRRSLRPPLGWQSEGFRGLARVTSFEAAVELCQLVCPVGLLKFPRTTHLINLGAATGDDIVAEPSLPVPIHSEERVVITEKIDGANLGFSLSSSHELLVQNRSHYVHSGDHAQFKALDSWVDDHRESLYAVLDRDNTFVERYVLYGEWMAATHSIPYTALKDLFYAFDLYDRATNTFASRSLLEQRLANTNIEMTPVLRICDSIPTSDVLAQMVSQRSDFYAGPVEGIYVKIETDQAVRKRGKVVRGDFIAGNEHWTKGIIRWNHILNSM